MMPDPRPTEIQKIEGKGLRIRWQDQHEGLYPYPALRESCQCASCVDEWSGKKRIKPEDIPKGIHPTSITAVGHYAISIHWSDGHETGIYPFDELRSLCPCQKCKPR